MEQRERLMEIQDGLKQCFERNKDKFSAEDALYFQNTLVEMHNVVVHKMYELYAKIKVTFPPKSYQEQRPGDAFSHALKVEVDGKMLLCRDITFNTSAGKLGELTLVVSPSCFEIAVEPEKYVEIVLPAEASADELINEIESVMKVKGDKNEQD